MITRLTDGQTDGQTDGRYHIARCRALKTRMIELAGRWKNFDDMFNRFGDAVNSDRFTLNASARGGLWGRTPAITQNLRIASRLAQSLVRNFARCIAVTSVMVWLLRTLVDCCSPISDVPHGVVCVLPVVVNYSSLDTVSPHMVVGLFLSRVRPWSGCLELPERRTVWTVVNCVT